MPRTQVLDKTRDAPAPSERSPRPKESNRDFIEQIVVAFILAFLVRGFEAEAFVIPTGSMAPTLMGRHKDVVCPQCGTQYQVNAAEEPRLRQAQQPPVESGVCTNCRFRYDGLGEQPSFKGDRILVMKFPYGLTWLPGGGGPKRWDVVVFRYPEEPEVNYIKRCVGLPNEELRVNYGDILTRPLGSAPEVPFQIERKPLMHQKSMQSLVWDDAHRPRAFADRPEWRRWQGENGWGEGPDGVFIVEPSETWARLGYHHLAPDPRQWEAALTGKPISPPRAALITDYIAYNSGEVTYANQQHERGDWYQPHWVGDLTLSCRLEVTRPDGKVRIELVEAGVPHRCEIDLTSGEATLSRGDQPLGPAVVTEIRGPGAHDIVLANVDDRLTLWVDGRTPFGEGLTFDGTADHTPTAADLQPVSISTRGASVQVSGLVLTRDIYYTQSPGYSDFSGPPWNSWPAGAFDPNDPYRRVVDLFDRLADTTQFAALGTLKPKDYPIRPGHYMMMGDNSPRSKDSRGWGEADRAWDPNERASWEVPESLIIGKAFYVYWPHGKPLKWNVGLSRDWRVPFIPQFERMKWIR